MRAVLLGDCASNPLPGVPPQFLNVPMFRNVTLKCLTEIAGVSVSQYEEQFVTLFTLTMMQLKQVLQKHCTVCLGVVSAAGCFACLLLFQGLMGQ